jgi:acyl-ACP thioesterase
MIEEATTFEMFKQVQLFHTDTAGKASLATLCRFAQESAGYHAERLGFGIMRLAELGIAWVLREQAMSVVRRPALGEVLRVVTWPTRAERILCHRDCRIEDAAGGLVARGTSVWFGLDLKTRRPLKAESFFRLQWAAMPAPVFEEPLPDLDAPAGDRAEEIRVVRASDLDALGHMNNLRYLDWIEDHLHGGVPEAQAMLGVRIRHAREVTAGDAVRIRHEERGGDVLVSMQDDGHGREVCLARIFGSERA